MKRFELRKILSDRLLVFDGAMGTELYTRHVFTNRSYDEVCLSMPKLVSTIHEEYIKAGADVITTNSFGANAIQLKGYGLSEKVESINKAAAELARKVADSCDSRKVYVAGSVGPIFSLGSTRENRVAALVEQLRALAPGVDFIIFETLPSRDAAYEASLAMKEFAEEKPFMLSFAISDDSERIVSDVTRLFQPFDDCPEPDALGLNCGTGPAHILTALETGVKCTKLPIVVQPNAGSPRMIDGRQLYLCSPEYLATYGQRYVNLGARGIGGCCGTTPAHIEELARSLKSFSKAVTHIVISEAEKKSDVLVPEKPLSERSMLGRKLANGEWITMIETTPPLTWVPDKLIEKAIICRQHGIDTLNVPDGPRASPRLSALVTAALIQQKAGIETVLHICGRDRNTIGLQADMLGAAALGIRNILFITGDPPKLGNYSFATGVFDTDSIGLVRIQKGMNRGIDIGGQPVKPATETVAGVGADPNAIDFEREVRRMREKVAAGADYVTTQPVFDPDALFRFMDAIADLNVPIIAGIWPLVSLKNALFMRNEVPGVVVPDSILERMSSRDTAEAQLAEGIAIAKEAVERIRSRVAGVQVSAPFGRIQAAFDVLGC